MHRCGWSVAIVVLSLSLIGCASVQVGHDFPLGSFATKVERGVTTQTQVRQWLGDPAGTGVEVEGDGKRFDLWTYYHGKGKLPRLGNAKLKMLQIKFDSNGVVRSYNWTGE